MTITNPNLYTVDVSSVEVTWNHDDGAQQGNKDLKLDRVDFGSTEVWNDTSLHAGPSLTFTPSSAVNIPAANPNPATITITFRFDNNYATTDGTEKIKINFSTAGCEATPVQQPPAVP
jgi:hypothetical protein